MKIWGTERLRDLCNLYDELHILEEPENYEIAVETKARKNRESVYEENYTWLMEYLDHRAKKDLSDREYKSLIQIMDQPLDDLNHEILKSCQLWMKDECRDEITPPKVRGQECFGTSLYWLNEISRKNERTMFPVFVKAYLTAVMGRICFSEPANSKEKLEKVFRKNQIVGYYNDKIFPSVRISGPRDALKLNLGYVYQVPSVICPPLLQDDKIDIELLKKVEEFFMFLSNIEKSSSDLPGISYTLAMPKCDFNMFNFIWNIPEYKTHLDQLYNIWKDYLVKEKDWTKERAEKEIEKAKKDSLFEELRVWCEDNGGYVFPVYNAELMSYILEKCRNLYEDAFFEIDEEVNWGEIDNKFFDYTVEFMEQIYEVLKEQDDFYERARRQGEEIKYLAEIFSSCPVIQYIREKKPLIPPEIAVAFDRSGAIKEAKEQRD